MKDRARPWLALLISALVHLGVAFVLIGQARRPDSVGGGMPHAGRALMVSLVSAQRPAARSSAPAAAKTPAKAEPAKEARPGAEGSRPVEHHYFGASEVTQQAVVAEGLVAGSWLIVPGLEPQEVRLEVWVNDEGTVERVEVESPLPEEDRQRLLSAFSRVRFLPGRIGRIAVHSRVSMKILVDYAVRA